MHAVGRVHDPDQTLAADEDPGHEHTKDEKGAKREDVSERPGDEEANRVAEEVGRVEIAQHALAVGQVRLDAGNGVFAVEGECVSETERERDRERQR